MAKRALLAGLFHETHSFLEESTPLDAFRELRGDELFSARGDGSPLSGVISVADESAWEVIPIIDLRATPSGTVEDEVFEYFWSAFRKHAAAPISTGDVGGIFLVLHGAMVTQSIRDVEGELISRIRDLPGAEALPICGVLDLHGNISQRTIEQTQGLIAYRENPHTDACETAVRAARLLDMILTSRTQPISVWGQAPVIWPPTGTGTASDPMRTLEEMAREIEAREESIAFVNVMGGFAFADTADTGVSFAATTFGEPAVARGEIGRLRNWAIAHRDDGCPKDRPLVDCSSDIEADVAAGRTPVIIVEPADNIGGGAPGDTTELLSYILDRQFPNSACVINDPVAVAELVDRGTGSCHRLSIGARKSSGFCSPVEVDVEVISVSDGRFELEDPNSHLASMNGLHIDMGPCAVVRSGEVSVLLTSKKTPPFDLGQLRSQGIEPESCSVVGVKAAVAHRRAFDPITASTYTVSTAGPCSSDLSVFPWSFMKHPIRD